VTRDTNSARGLDLGIDLDGVLYPFVEDLTPYAARHLRVRPQDLPPVTRWNFFEDWGLDFKSFQAIQTEAFGSGLFDRLDPDPEGVAVLSELAAEGHAVHYVTARHVEGVSPAEMAVRTREWIGRHGLPAHSLTMTTEKASVPTDVFLDDAPHNVEALLKAGHSAPMLLHRAWNAEAIHLPRVLSWRSFASRVRAMARRSASPA
jgi:5'(3')-deoxyribonucleotidase